MQESTVSAGKIAGGLLKGLTTNEFNPDYNVPDGLQDIAKAINRLAEAIERLTNKEGTDR